MSEEKQPPKSEEKDEMMEEKQTHTNEEKDEMINKDLLQKAIDQSETIISVAVGRDGSFLRINKGPHGIDLVKFKDVKNGRMFSFACGLQPDLQRRCKPKNKKKCGNKNFH